MIDAEVIRMRRLRIAALRARALAVVLDAADTCEEDTCKEDTCDSVFASVFARGAVSCWGIARLASGRLKSHPNLSCQREPGALRLSVDTALASLTGWVAAKQGKQLRVFAQQLQLLARELDDARALTWSGDLSDALGRAQQHLRRLVSETACDARREAGGALVAQLQPDMPAESSANNWPYLAI
jgi:hypothetical protein